MLTDFFRINLPYGMKKNENGEWAFFNRNFLPLGWTRKQLSFGENKDELFSSLPLSAKYTKLTQAILLKLAWDPESGIQKNDKGEITEVFFYNDETNPRNNFRYWNQYLEKLKLLSQCDVKRLVDKSVIKSY